MRYSLRMRSFAMFAHTVALAGVLVMSGCAALAPTTSDPEPTSSSSIADEPVSSCDMLNAMPQGLAQQKASEVGCVEDNSGNWVEAGDAVEAELSQDATQPGGGVSWSDAASHFGSVERVCGPLAGSGTSQDDVFLNLGHDYPSSRRFQIVVWDVGALEPIAPGATLCTTGKITLYEGVGQIELTDPTAIEIFE